MSNELNEKWDDYGKAASGSLFAAGLALQRLGLCASDETALDSLFMAGHEIKALAREMELPLLAELAEEFESLCGLLLTVGIGLDDHTLFLLLEAYAGMQAGVETSAVFWRDVTTGEVGALLSRLRQSYDTFLQKGATACC